MPRNSPYKIVLSDEEERQLRKAAAEYTSPYCEVVRAKIILLAA
ncbi:MAG TPA: hypothetical protein VM492_00375 [Sumerlaeia bacterium]|nr:hypothetical protein [Sumerlaeia bacterium]